ncbi:MAG: DUF6335 family protein [Spirulinaceae cyanobacterium]
MNNEDNLPGEETIRETTGISDRNTGIGEVLEEIEENPTIGKSTTGGDLDTNQYQASVVGEEAIGGTTPTPAQNNIDEMAVSAGVEMSDVEAVQMKSKLEQRDEERWELNRNSAEQ